MPLKKKSPPDKASAKAPPPSFAVLIDAGTVVPDERDGPYALGSYHAKVTGEFRGYKSRKGWDEWDAINETIMARQTSWAVDLDHRRMARWLEIVGYGISTTRTRYTQFRDAGFLATQTLSIYLSTGTPSTPSSCSPTASSMALL